MSKLLNIKVVGTVQNKMNVNDLVYLKTTGRFLRLKRDAHVGDLKLRGIFDDDARRGSQHYSVIDKVD